MKYKSFQGTVIYDGEAKIFHGEVAGLKDVVTFQGRTVDELDQAFKDSVDDYLDWCEERGKEPEKPYSGKFNLRMPPELYVKVVAHAAQEGLSINSYILKRLSA